MQKSINTEHLARVSKECDCICPKCGTLNRSLYLHETGGLYECEKCGTIIQTAFSDFRSVKSKDAC